MAAFVLLFLFLFLASSAQSKEIFCNVKSFGAAGDGVSYDTAAIQLAIDFCAAQIGKQDGYGVAAIVLPAPGRYLTGTLFLRSRTVLNISPGATLLASPLQEHYPSLSSRWYLVLAENASDVGITGSGSDRSTGFDVHSSEGVPSSADVGATGSDVGTVDGQSSKFVESFNSIKNVMVSWNQTGACSGDECRPRLLGFLDCEGVHIWNIQLHQPAYWCVHIVRSNNVSIHHISILGDFNTPNNDGIDINSSNNTSIYSCNIDTGDDAICPKTDYGPVFNLTVSRCWIRTKSCGVKFGSASNFDFYSLSFNWINIVDSHRGIGLQLRDSGNIYDVVFRNFNIMTRYYDISWWGRAEPIYVISCPRTPDTVVGSIHNISFINITAVSENGIVMSGPEGNLLRNLRLENTKLQLQRITNDSGGLLDYRPGCQGLVPHQNSGIFIERVSSLLLKKVQFSLASDLPMPFVPIDVSFPTSPESFEFVDFLLFYLTPLGVNMTRLV